MALPSWINVSTGLMFGGLSVLIGLLVVAWRLGSVANGLNQTSDNTSELSGKIDTMLTTTNFQKVGQIPDTVESMGEDLDEISSSLDNVSGVNNSIENIEASITSVDLKGIEQAVEGLFRDVFGDEGLPFGNSVHVTLENAGVDAAISLNQAGEAGSLVTVRFDEEVRTRAIIDLLDSDNELAAKEQALFDGEPNMRVPSPRQLNFTIRSSDIDALTEWVPLLVEKLDRYVVQTAESADAFDEKVSEKLGQ